MGNVDILVGGVLRCPTVRKRTKWNFGWNAEQPSVGIETSDPGIDTLLYRWGYIGLCAPSILIRRRPFQTEVEQTGASSQFYDKFSEFPSHSYQVPSKVWPIP